MLTFLKGFRLPNLWVATHYAFNYSQGFVRRGLLGEIARQLGQVEIYRYRTIVTLALLIQAATFFLLFIVIRRALRANPLEWSPRIALLVFLSSPGLVFFVHAIGYHDYLGVLFVASVLSVLRSRPFILWTAVVLVAPLMALIHEGLAVMFGPTLLFFLAVRYVRLAANGASSARISALAGMFLTAALLLFGLSGLVGSAGQEHLERVHDLERYVRTHSDFAPRAEAFDALAISAKTSLTTLMPWYWSRPEHVRIAAPSWYVFAPGFLWLVSYGGFSVWHLRLRRSLRAFLLALYGGASFAPLFMNLVGCDWNRWNAAATITSFSALLAVKLSFPGGQRELPIFMWTLGLVLCFVGLVSTTPLFDGVEVQFFPFDGHVRFLQRWLEDGAIVRPRG